MKNLRLLTFILTLFLLACGGNDENTEASKIQEELKKDLEMQEESGLSEDEEEEFDFVMPSALQITSIFSRYGAEFNKEYTNNLTNVNNYLSKESKLLNLGVYASDLCYCVLNNQSQLSIEFLKAVKKISEDVGMAAIFNSGPIFERFESNIGNRDSIMYIMADLQEQTDLYVKKSDQEHLAMMIFAGAWAEGMYIGLQDAKNLESGDEIVPRVVEQMTLLGNLIKGLELQPSQSEELEKFRSKYVDLKAYFENIEGVDLETFEYDLSKITDEHLNTIKAKVGEIRSEIVKVN
jgi:hypothetical protein